MLPSQQPPAHDVALQAQAPFTQVWPVAQAAQAAPFVPQVPALEVRHWPVESQHPLGHEDALQTHLPVPSHAWPAAHAAHAAPPVPQVAAAEVRH